MYNEWDSLTSWHWIIQISWHAVKANPSLIKFQMENVSSLVDVGMRVFVWACCGCMYWSFDFAIRQGHHFYVFFFIVDILGFWNSNWSSNPLSARSAILTVNKNLKFFPIDGVVMINKDVKSSQIIGGVLPADDWPLWKKGEKLNIQQDLSKELRNDRRWRLKWCP